MNDREVNGRTLAYLGDATWSLAVRKRLIQERAGIGKRLQKETIRYVSAVAQASFYERLHQAGWFTEAEEEVFRRGRNGPTGTLPRHASSRIYRISTGFEAIVGMLELQQNSERIEALLEQVWKSMKENTCHN